MTTPSLVLFNGPRHSGKDTAAIHCVKTFNARHFKMSRPLKDGIKAIFELTDEEVDYLEQIKTQPSFLLFGKSYVEVQISLSEVWAKKEFSETVFGDLAVRTINSFKFINPAHHLYVCSDSGFTSEAGPVVEVFGKENTLLVKIERQGKTFAGDSRSYIRLPGIETVTVSNSGNVEDYNKKIEKLVCDWIAR